MKPQRGARPLAGKTIFRRGLRDATITTLGGLVLGGMTAIVVVLLGHTVFPEVAESGTDMGMRLKVAVERFRNFSTGLPLRESEARGLPAAATGYVFLDVDAEYLPGSTSSAEAGAMAACRALQARFQASYRMASPGRQAAEAGAGQTAAALDCASSRPLNRYLLAELVKELRRRGAKLVVLDIVLEREQGVIGDQENRALLRELAAPSPVPVIYAAPLELVWEENSAPHRNVVSLASGSDMRAAAGARSPGEGAAYAAIAVPAPDRVLRRYPRCFTVEGSPVPAAGMPQLAAQLLTAQKQPGSCDAGKAEADRIVFTLPSITGHLSQVLGPHSSEQAQRESATRTFYRPVYGRCLAAHFWEAGGWCGEAPAGTDGPPSYYRDKVVVVGITNPVRRDWHITPLGNMVGAQVIVNAIRSRVQYPWLHEHSLAGTLGKELLIVLACIPFWFTFHLLRYGTAHPSPSGDQSGGEYRENIKRRVYLVLWYIAALSLVLATTFRMSFAISGPAPSLDVLIGVLAITTELYVEVAKWIVHSTEHFVGRLLPAP